MRLMNIRNFYAPGHVGRISNLLLIKKIYEFFSPNLRAKTGEYEKCHLSPAMFEKAERGKAWNESSNERGREEVREEKEMKKE